MENKNDRQAENIVEFFKKKDSIKRKSDEIKTREEEEEENGEKKETPHIFKNPRIF